MNTTFERCANTTDEWYTPREIIDALGPFELDPCAPISPLWPTAKKCLTKKITAYYMTGKVKEFG